jgi:sulfate adenylyltransferase
MKSMELLCDEETRQTLLNESVHLQHIILNDRQLCDLELLLNGGFAPLKGFLNEDDYKSVIENCRLVTGEIWPMPIVLDVPEGSGYKKGDRIVLCDQFSKPLAIVTIESVYTPDKMREAQQVYGTEDRDHFGVKMLLEQTGEVYLGGTIQGIELPKKYDFQELRRTPEETKEMFKKKGWDTVVGFQTRNPMHRAHFEIVRRAAEEIGGKVLIHPAVGQTKDGDIDYVTRVRSYKHVQQFYAKDFAELSLLPIAMRMAGPREALWHALIRKNYGCTHFIVGRDHAGPGKDANGIPFYGPYEAQDMVKEYEKEIGIKLVTPKEMVYVEEEQIYLPVNEVKEGYTVKNISGTELRALLRRGGEIPEWFSFPEVIKELRRTEQNRTGFTVFFTGLSGAGKSTIAQLLLTRLQELTGRNITFLDGDIVRQHLSKGLGFSKEDRNTNIERIGFVAAEVVRHGGIAICSAIAPYKESRDKNRLAIQEIGSYIEVYVSTPIEECKRRDTKGLYAKAEQGTIKGFTGVDDPYEIPENTEIVIDTCTMSPEESVEKVVAYLLECGSI